MSHERLSVHLPSKISNTLTPASRMRTAGTIVFAADISLVLRGVDHRQNTRYLRWQWQAFTRSAMFEAKQLQKHALECLRLQADCMQLAGVAHSPNMQSHFVSMARFWGALAISGPNSDTGPKLFVAEMRTT
jgi:hypothetical protein